MPMERAGRRAASGRHLREKAAVRPWFAALVLLAATVAGWCSAKAHVHGPRNIEVTGVSAPATPGQPMQMVYMTIRNRGTLPDQLKGALSPVAARVQLMDEAGPDGDRKAVAMFAIAPGEDLVLSAAGRHLALTGLRRPLAENESFKLALEFEHAGRIVVDVPVGPASAADTHRH